MLRKRTANGVPIKKMQGIRPAKKDQTWILVADRHRLCLYEKTRNEIGFQLELRDIWLNPDGRKKASELVSDRPGRSFDSKDKSRHGQAGGARHSYAEAMDPTDRVVTRLGTEAVRLMGKTSKRNKVDRLIVVAGPTLWGVLKPRMHKAFPSIDLSLHEKDFAWLTEAKVRERLGEYLL